MATASTGWRCTHTASVTSSSNTSVTIRVTCYWKNEGWRYDINNVSAWVYCDGSWYTVKDSGSVNANGSNTAAYSMGYHDFTISKGTSSKNITCYAEITSKSSYVSGTKSSSATYISVPAKPSYTISYNANGGSGAPGNQTKWYGTNLTLSYTKPSRAGNSFQGWATSSSGNVAYKPGGTYSSNSSVTLYAKWKADTYTISYNANGGSGAPGNQTKTYGVDLTLSSVKPTRADYNFLGWSTSASGGVIYNSGSKYTKNGNATLYAVWELAYTRPRLNNFSADRCDSDGTANESGTYAKITFTWSTDKTVTDAKIEWKLQSATTWSNTSITVSGTNGSISQIIGSGEISIENSYNVRAYVSDSGGTTYSSLVTLGTLKVPIDVKSGGTGVSFGKVAESDGIADFGFTPRFQTAPQFIIDGRARTPIRMFTGSTNGDGVLIQGDGRILIGSGESCTRFLDDTDGWTSGNTEDLILLGDNSVFISTNMQNGADGRKKFIFGANGSLTVPGDVMSGNDTGWIDVTYGNSISTYPSGSPVQVKRFGKVVQMAGQVTNSTTWQEHLSMLTIPSGFRPAKELQCIQQGSGSNRYLISIETDGKVVANRYSNNTTMSNTVPLNSWLCINATWIID